MSNFTQHEGWTPGLCVHQANTFSMGWHLLACKFINQMSIHWCVIRKATTDAGWVKPHKTSEQTLCRHWTLRTLNIWRWPHVTFLEYKVPAGRANRNSFSGIKNLRISFMLVTKIIPVDVPKKWWVHTWVFLTLLGAPVHLRLSVLPRASPQPPRLLCLSSFWSYHVEQAHQHLHKQGKALLILLAEKWDRRQWSKPLPPLLEKQAEDFWCARPQWVYYGQARIANTEAVGPGSI